ncbi:MAG: methyltransferase [Aestuariibacter sp.]
MLSPASECLLRSKDLFERGRWLLVNPTDTNIFQQLAGNVSGFHQYFDIYQQALNSAPGSQHFGLSCPERDFDGIVLYISKAKKHTEQLLHYLATLLKTNGHLFILGENKGGIKSSNKFLANFGNKPQKIDSARHCALHGVEVAQCDSNFTLSQALSWTDVEVNDVNIKVASLPGVFSHGELDEGTRLLLENTESVPNGNILDFACGAGVIGAWLHRLNPDISLTLSDINASALYCCEQTLKENNISGNIIPSHGMRDVHGKFAAIYTNPPFHTGVKTDHSITRDFLKAAVEQLQPQGKLILVANRFLPYPDQMQETFGNVRKLSENGKFSLYESIFIPM